MLTALALLCAIVPVTCSRSIIPEIMNQKGSVLKFEVLCSALRACVCTKSTHTKRTASTKKAHKEGDAKPGEARKGQG